MQSLSRRTARASGELVLPGVRSRLCPIAWGLAPGWVIGVLEKKKPRQESECSSCRGFSVPIAVGLARSARDPIVVRVPHVAVDFACNADGAVGHDRELHRRDGVDFPACIN